MNHDRLKQALDLAREVENSCPENLHADVAGCFAIEAVKGLQNGENETAKLLLELARVNADLAKADSLFDISVFLKEISEYLVSIQEISDHLRTQP